MADAGHNGILRGMLDFIVETSRKKDDLRVEKQPPDTLVHLGCSDDSDGHSHPCVYRARHEQVRQNRYAGLHPAARRPVRIVCGGVWSRAYAHPAGPAFNGGQRIWRASPRCSAVRSRRANQRTSSTAAGHPRNA